MLKRGYRNGTMNIWCEQLHNYYYQFCMCVCPECRCIQTFIESTIEILYTYREGERERKREWLTK